MPNRQRLSTLTLVLTTLSLCIVMLPRAQGQALLLASSLQQAEASFSLSGERDAVLTLRRPLHFHPGDDPAWSNPALDDSAWPLVDGDRNWRSNGLRSQCGMAWYRFQVILPPGSGPYSILLPHIGTAYQLFLNGQLAAGAGDMPPHARMYITKPQLVDLPANTSITVALRVWHDPTWAGYVSGGPDNAIIVGRTSLLRDRLALDRLSRLWRNSDWLDLTALELLAALIALPLYLLGRSEREYLWFFVLTLGDALNHAINLWGRFRSHPVHPAESLQSLCYGAFLIASLFFYRDLLKAKTSVAFRLALVCSAAWTLNTQLASLPGFTASAENVGELIFTAPVYLWIVVLILRRIRQHSPDARLLALPVSLLLGTAFYYQLLFTIGTFGHPEIMRYYPIMRGLFYADFKDGAEAFFLIGMLLILGNRFARTSRQRDRTMAELEAARSVQRVLVPECLARVPGMRIETAYHPAQEVGGDFFQIIPLLSGATLFVVGDVAGKGVPAALTVSLIVGTLQTLAVYVDGPGEILAGLNRSLAGRCSGFTTCIALQFSPDLTSLTIANSGHLPAYADGHELATEVSLPLGIVQNATFPEKTYALAGMAHLTLLTDGVPEAMQRRELFGFERTLSILSQGAASIAQSALNFGQTDDITVLTIDLL